MALDLNPYLNYNGQAREAMEFYHQVLGGDLSISTFGEMDPTSENPNGVMHATLITGAGHRLMASDMPPGMEAQPGNNFSVSLSGDDEATLRGYWEGLAAGGEIMMPLEKQIWGDTFGAVVDKFGISWMVDITPPQS